MGKELIKLNVGGRLFETTATTLRSAGPHSLLSSLSLAPTDPPPFIDRDPELFTVLLALLRSHLLPSSDTRRFSKQSLVDEAVFYGIDSLLQSAMAPPPLLGFDASLSATLVPASDPMASTFSAGPDGSVWLAHGGQISSYDWSLSYSSTLRTYLEEITSLCHVSSDIAAAGSLDSPGLHFYNVAGGRHVGAVHWSDPSDPRVYKARVTAIADPTNGEERRPVFAAFECPHRENCVLAVDPTTLQVMAEIGRQSGSASKSAAPGRVAYLQELGLIFVSAVSSGAFGYSGYMRLWDPRSGDAVWEASEPGGGGWNSSRFGDSFSDADVDRERMGLYKVCWKSGDVGVADLRRLGDDPWMYLSDGVRSSGGGWNSVLHCYKSQLFVSRESGLEVYYPLLSHGDDGGDGDSSSYDSISSSSSRYRRLFVDTEEDAKRGMIRGIEGGGDRLFLGREGLEGIEVWETSNLSRAVSFL